jgi:2-methylcitrate dehydratase PrpD
MNGIDDLAACIAQLKPTDIAAPTMEKLRLHVADTLGAWITATATAEGRALIAYRNDLQSLGQNATANSGLFDNLTVNCALTRLSEVDDIHLASMTTPGSIVIPAAMTIATSWPDAEVGDVAAGIIAGYEAMIRLALAIKGPDILYRGIWPTYFTASFGTTALAARLLRLDESRTGHALALALSMAAPSVGQHHGVTTARWLSVGNAARNGLTAALAARSGFTADVNVLQSRLFPDVYGLTPDLEIMTAGLGVEPKLNAVSFKPWCAARQTMAATQALRELIDDGVAAADIREINASVLPPHCKMIDHGVRAGDRASHLTSLPYQMAVAALHPETVLDVNQTPAALSQEMQLFMARIKVMSDDSLLAGYPTVWPARIEVVTSLGRHERLVRDVPGDPTRPFAITDIGQKFHRLASPILEITGARIDFEFVISTLQSRKSLSSMMQELDHVVR